MGAIEWAIVIGVVGLVAVGILKRLFFGKPGKKRKEPQPTYVRLEVIKLDDRRG